MNAPHLTTIAEAVAGHYRMPVSDLYLRSRAPRISTPRQVAIYLSRKAGGTTVGIGRAFGLHHSTVIYACHTVRDGMSVYPDFREAVTTIQDTVNKQTQCSQP